jgi:hypothetical protein
MCDSGRMVIAFMTTFPATEGFGFSGPADRALGLPEKVGGVHDTRYTSLSEREYKFDIVLERVGITIVEDVVLAWSISVVAVALCDWQWQR